MRGDAQAPVAAPAKPRGQQQKKQARGAETGARHAAALQARRYARAGRGARGCRAETGRRARKPADGAQPPSRTQSAQIDARRMSPQCAQVSAPDQAIAGCTRVIEDPRQKPKRRAAAYYNRGNAYAAKGDAGRGDRRL